MFAFGFPNTDLLAQFLQVLLLAFALDVACGDPQWLYRRVPHPVALLGSVIDRLDTAFNQPPWELRFGRGLAVTFLLVTLAAAFGGLMAWLFGLLSWGWMLEAVLVSTLLAYRGLYDHVKAVGQGLAKDLPSGRAAVARIVGREVSHLDEAGVSRAALESLAENFSDGVVAPLFWFLLFGLPGLFVYKTVNTLDSMIGHHTPRHEQFGKATARLDDFLNLVPARLAAILVIAAAAFLPGASPVAALRAALRDAPKHRSPNAGWQEAALAGALGLALAGPRNYGTQSINDAWMGDGRAQASRDDVTRGLDLYVAAGLVTAVIAVAALLLVGLAGSDTVTS